MRLVEEDIQQYEATQNLEADDPEEDSTMEEPEEEQEDCTPLQHPGKRAPLVFKHVTGKGALIQLYHYVTKIATCV